MSEALIVFLLVAVTQLVIWAPPLWKYHVLTARAYLVATTLSYTWLLIDNPTFLVVLLGCLAAYRLVNLGRVAKNRMRDEYLRGVTWRTAWWFLSIEIISVSVWWLLSRMDRDAGAFWYLLIVFQAVFAVILLLVTSRHMYATRPPKKVATVSTKALPSLTVAVPARNEDEALRRCLEDLVASDYPKLEIIVLDDCSQNRNTPEIIRSFAHAGVRFIAGVEAEEYWLAKNFAYQQLADVASGEYILFCGTDARFEPGSLRLLIETMLHKKKNMVSVIPRNVVPKNQIGLAMLVQPMRYAWEVSLPRKTFRRPPVLSTCWVIQRKLLENSGGFKAVSRSVVPESYFARVAVVHDGYSFMQSDQRIGIRCDKDYGTQHDTATRTKYPQLHRRPELVFLLTLAELITILLPLCLLVASIGTPALRGEAITGGITTVVLVLWYMLVVTFTYRRPVWLSLIALPFAVLHDVALLNYSMLKYEFSAVLWKGRNICIPVMRIERSLKTKS
ncbi:glycosyltransferase [Candidatus Saccharibacteria bacterium]|nr:glycosyltransferase [Candidatus Saccharibacteria bacterium]